MFNSLVYISAVRPLFKENFKLVMRADFQGSWDEQILIVTLGSSGLPM